LPSKSRTATNLSGPLQIPLPLQSSRPRRAARDRGLRSGGRRRRCSFWRGASTRS